jgi:tRNA (guanine26-N2/guanine27-N2)-dimethyltransferase
VITLCREELDTSSYYDYHVFAQWLKVSPPDIGTVIGRLKGAVYAASRVHYSGYGIKTDAPVSAITEAINAR